MKLFSRATMIAATKRLYDSFTVCLEVKNSSPGPANCFLLLKYRQKKVVRSTLSPRIANKKNDREMEPNGRISRCSYNFLVLQTF